MEAIADPKDLVRRSYDQISYAYRGDSLPRDRNYFRWLAELTPLLQPGDAVLDLGCGCGVPVAQELAQQFAVTGVDISPVQNERARGLVPQATFICGDMEENHEPIPQPLATKRYSGRFMVRVPPELHRRLALEAAEAGVSLNRLASKRLTVTASSTPSANETRST